MASLAVGAPAGATYAPKPEYPNAARLSGISGSGIFVVSVTPEGKVQTVVVGQSTGNALLDEAGKQALAKWRFPSGPARSMRIPLGWQAKKAAVPEYFRRGQPIFTTVGRVIAVDLGNSTITVQTQKRAATIVLNVSVNVATGIHIGDRRARLEDIKPGNRIQGVFMVQANGRMKAFAVEVIPWKSTLPVATPVKGSPGFVRSPYPPHEILDARGVASGAEVNERETKKKFVVP